MRAPPSSNLVAELFVISSIINNSVSVVFQIGLIILLAGAYTLVLYSSSSQGQKKIKSAGLNTIEPKRDQGILHHSSHGLRAIFHYCFFISPCVSEGKYTPAAFTN